MIKHPFTKEHERKKKITTLVDACDGITASLLPDLKTADIKASLWDIVADGDVLKTTQSMSYKMRQYKESPIDTLEQSLTAGQGITLTKSSAGLEVKRNNLDGHDLMEAMESQDGTISMSIDPNKENRLDIKVDCEKFKEHMTSSDNSIDIAIQDEGQPNCKIDLKVHDSAKPGINYYLGYFNTLDDLRQYVATQGITPINNKHYAISHALVSASTPPGENEEADPPILAAFPAIFLYQGTKWVQQDLSATLVLGTFASDTGKLSAIHNSHGLVREDGVKLESNGFITVNQTFQGIFEKKEDVKIPVRKLVVGKSLIFVKETAKDVYNMYKCKSVTTGSTFDAIWEEIHLHKFESTDGTIKVTEVSEGDSDLSINKLKTDLFTSSDSSVTFAMAGNKLNIQASGGGGGPATMKAGIGSSVPEWQDITKIQVISSKGVITENTLQVPEPYFEIGEDGQAGHDEGSYHTIKQGDGVTFTKGTGDQVGVLTITGEYMDLLSDDDSIDIADGVEVIRDQTVGLGSKKKKTLKVKKIKKELFDETGDVVAEEGADSKVKLKIKSSYNPGITISGRGTKTTSGSVEAIDKEPLDNIDLEGGDFFLSRTDEASKTWDVSYVGFNVGREEEATDPAKIYQTKSLNLKGGGITLEYDQSKKKTTINLPDNSGMTAKVGNSQDYKPITKINAQSQLANVNDGELVLPPPMFKPKDGGTNQSYDYITQGEGAKLSISNNTLTISTEKEMMGIYIKGEVEEASELLKLTTAKKGDVYIVRWKLDPDGTKKELLHVNLLVQEPYSVSSNWLDMGPVQGPQGKPGEGFNVKGWISDPLTDLIKETTANVGDAYVADTWKVGDNPNNWFFNEYDKDAQGDVRNYIFLLAEAGPGTLSHWKSVGPLRGRPGSGTSIGQVDGYTKDGTVTRVVNVGDLHFPKGMILEKNPTYANTAYLSMNPINFIQADSDGTIDVVDVDRTAGQYGEDKKVKLRLKKLKIDHFDATEGSVSVKEANNKIKLGIDKLPKTLFKDSQTVTVAQEGTQLKFNSTANISAKVDGGTEGFINLIEAPKGSELTGNTLKLKGLQVSSQTVNELEAGEGISLTYQSQGNKAIIKATGGGGGGSDLTIKGRDILDSKDNSTKTGTIEFGHMFSLDEKTDKSGYDLRLRHEGALLGFFHSFQSGLVVAAKQHKSDWAKGKVVGGVFVGHAGEPDKIKAVTIYVWDKDTPVRPTEDDIKRESNWEKSLILPNTGFGLLTTTVAPNGSTHPVAKHKGQIIYDDGTGTEAPANKGFWYSDGSKWVKMDIDGTGGSAIKVSGQGNDSGLITEEAMESVRFHERDFALNRDVTTAKKFVVKSRGWAVTDDQGAQATGYHGLKFTGKGLKFTKEGSEDNWIAHVEVPGGSSGTFKIKGNNEAGESKEVEASRLDFDTGNFEIEETEESGKKIATAKFKGINVVPTAAGSQAAKAAELKFKGKVEVTIDSGTKAATIDVPAIAVKGKDGAMQAVEDIKDVRTIQYDGAAFITEYGPGSDKSTAVLKYRGFPIEGPSSPSVQYSGIKFEGDGVTVAKESATSSVVKVTIPGSVGSSLEVTGQEHKPDGTKVDTDIKNVTKLAFDNGQFSVKQSTDANNATIEFAGLPISKKDDKSFQNKLADTLEFAGDVTLAESGGTVTVTVASGKDITFKGKNKELQDVTIVPTTVTYESNRFVLTQDETGKALTVDYRGLPIQNATETGASNYTAIKIDGNAKVTKEGESTAVIKLGTIAAAGKQKGGEELPTSTDMRKITFSSDNAYVAMTEIVGGGQDITVTPAIAVKGEGSSDTYKPISQFDLTVSDKESYDLTPATKTTEGKLNLKIRQPMLSADKLENLKTKYPAASHIHRLAMVDSSSAEGTGDTIYFVSSSTTDWQSLAYPKMDEDVRDLDFRYPQKLKESNQPYKETDHRNIDYTFVKKDYVIKSETDGGLGFDKDDFSRYIYKDGMGDCLLHNIFGVDNTQPSERDYWVQVLYNMGSSDGIYTRQKIEDSSSAETPKKKKWGPWGRIGVAALTAANHAVLISDNDYSYRPMLLNNEQALPLRLYQDPSSNIIIDNTTKAGGFKVNRSGFYDIYVRTQYTWETRANYHKDSKGLLQLWQTYPDFYSSVGKGTKMASLVTTEDIASKTDEWVKPFKGKFEKQFLERGKVYFVCSGFQDNDEDTERNLQLDPFKNMVAIDPTPSETGGFKTAEAIVDTLYHTLSGLSFDVGYEVRAEKDTTQQGNKGKILGEAYNTDLIDTQKESTMEATN